MSGRLNKDRLFIRLAADGSAVANSAIWRKQMPRSGGKWKDITKCVLGCCDLGESFVVFTNSSAANITAISFNGYTWSGTLATGGYLVVPLPYMMAETITITTSAFSGRTLTTSTKQGGGVISAIGALAAVTNTATVTSDPGTQYLIALT